MGACPEHGEYHDDNEQLICWSTRLCKYQTLEAACRRWRAGIKANSVKWTIKGTRRIQKAGREIYKALDDLEIK
jgi:hypothetical protein